MSSSRPVAIPSTFRFVHYSILLPGASRADALARYRDAVWALNWKYSDMEASATRSLPPASPPPFEGEDEKLLARRTAHAGTPDELVEALLEVRRQAPVRSSSWRAATCRCSNTRRRSR